MKVIFNDIDPDDFILAMRAVKWMIGSPHQDAILAYGPDDEQEEKKHFYVKRNKSGFSVKPC